MQEVQDAERQRRAARHPVSGEGLGLGANDRSLGAIFNDKHHYNLFVNSFLVERDPEMTKDIIKARVDKTLLTEDQNIFLDKARVDYNKRIFEASAIKNMLTVKQVKDMARKDARVALLIGKVGENNAPAFLGDKLEECAVNDPAGFQRIIGSFKEAAKIQGGFWAKTSEKFLQHRLTAYGITGNKFTEAVASGATRESRKNLSKLVKEKLTGFWKGLNTATGGFVAFVGGRKLLQNVKMRNLLLSECNNHLATVASLLDGTLNDDVRMEIDNQTFEGRRETKPLEVLTIKDLRTLQNELGPDKRKGRFETALNALARTVDRTKTWAGLNDAQKQSKTAELEGLKESFVTSELARQKQYKGGGLIAELVGTFQPTREEIRAHLDTIATAA